MKNIRLSCFTSNFFNKIISDTLRIKKCKSFYKITQAAIWDEQTEMVIHVTGPENEAAFLNPFEMPGWGQSCYIEAACEFIASIIECASKCAQGRKSGLICITIADYEIKKQNFPHGL